MSNYDIVGIGNALVDTEIQVTDSELVELGIDKGVMTLVDQERFDELMRYFHAKDHGRACGGSAANTIIGATQLGASCYYACKVASDGTGQFYRNDLVKNQVAHGLDMELPDGRTGTCLVLITPDAERTMLTYLGITESFSIENINNDILKAAHCVYIEGYLVTSPTAKDAAQRAKSIADQHGVKTAFTLSDPNMVSFFKDAQHDIIGSGVDLLFCNEKEALLFADTNDLNTATQAIGKVAKTYAITLGSKGALIYDGTTHHSIDAHPATAIDSNGAGDMFAGGFLAGLVQGKSHVESGNLASFSASRVVANFGPRLNSVELDAVREFQSNTTVAS